MMLLVLEEEYNDDLDIGVSISTLLTIALNPG